MAKARKTKRAGTGKRAVRDLGVKGKSGNVRGGASSGIDALIRVTQQKTDGANSDALSGATKQKG